MRTIEHLDKHLAEQVIRQCNVCYLGMADTDGTPYVLPMSFGYESGTIYLHSAQEGRSLSIIGRNPKVNITFCTDREVVFQNPDIACSYSMRSKSVLAWGTVCFEDNEDKKEEALHIIMKQYSGKEFRYSAPSIRNVKIWKIKIEQWSCKEFGASYKK